MEIKHFSRRKTLLVAGAAVVTAGAGLGISEAIKKKPDYTIIKGSSFSTNGRADYETNLGKPVSAQRPVKREP